MRKALQLSFPAFWLSILCVHGAAFPKFSIHIIDNYGHNMGQTALADVDKDGDLDWIAGNASHAGAVAGEICWWEFVTAEKWVRYPMGKGYTDVGGAAFDVNADGWTDFVAGSKLLLNSREPKTKPFEVIDIGTIHSHDTEFADVNGDGKMDLIANSDKTGLYWYEIPADPSRKWKPNLIASSQSHKVHGGVSPKAVADLDGDGENDIITAQAWYKNMGKGLKWEQHKNIPFGESHRYGVAVRTWVCDMDKDGDVDFVQAENDNPDSRIAWFENDGKGNWQRHMVRDKGKGEDFHSLAVADFDNDGDLDIYAGAGPLSASKTFGTYIWENKSKSWIEHKLSDKHCHEAEAADVDGDGDIDICSKPWSGEDEHFFLQNLLINNQKRPKN